MKSIKCLWLNGNKVKSDNSDNIDQVEEFDNENGITEDNNDLIVTDNNNSREDKEDISN